MNRHSETLVECSRPDRLSTPKIVVGVDGTAANWSAVSWAVAEARRADAPLLLVATGSSAAAAASANTDDFEQESSERITSNLLEQVRLRVTGRVRDVSTRVTTGEPSQALLRVADGDDLLVIGKRRGSPWSTSVLGSTAVAVAARCNGPVVVVPEAWTVAGHGSHRLVAGIDGQSDAGVLDVAFDRAQTMGVALVVVHAWRGPEPDSVSTDEVAHVREEVGQRLAEAVAPWVQEYPEVDVSLECHSLTPIVSLLGVASDAQLLVVGRNSRPRYSGDLGTGSTVRKVLHHASCPVMVVPRASGDAECHRLGLLEELPGYSTS